ncbi:MAG TPA: hypothetical protein V6D10_17580 [Trichocoleus sp.]|jgi:hypothetical protein
MLKKLIFSLAALSVVLLSITAPSSVNAQSDPAQQCDAAIDRATNVLVGSRHLWITDMKARNAEGIYVNYPYEQPMILQIAIAGNAAPAVMASPQLLTTVARTITTDCSRVGLVSYALANTDWVVDLGMIGNRLQWFECVEADRRRGSNPLLWGQTLCF